MTPSRLNPKSWKPVTQWHGNARVSHVDFLDFDPQSIGTWNYRVTHHIWLSQHHQTERTSLIQIWYKTTSSLKPNPWKLVIQEHGNANLSHWTFLNFELQRIRSWNYRVIQNLWLPHNHQTYRKSLIQIWYTTLSKMEAKHIKTSHSRAWECKPFMHGFMMFWIT